jgi:hypothetical protein
VNEQDAVFSLADNVLLVLKEGQRTVAIGTFGITEGT